MFLNKALKSKEFEESLKDNQKTREISDFIGHVLTDLNYFFENSFHNFKNIKEEMLKMQLNPNQETVEGEDDSKTKIEKMKDQCKMYLDLGRVNLTLLSHFIRLVPQEFNTPEWSKQTAHVINLYADRMSSKKYKEYRFHGIQDLGLKPLKFIATLIEIYTQLGGMESIMKEIVSDERSFSRKTMIDIGSTAFDKKLVPDQILKRFEEVILTLDELEEEYKNIQKIIGDEYPDEFTCGLTYELMKDPVRLKTSDIVVDRKNIEKQITLNGEIDPFNRTTLKRSDLIPLPELKAQLDNWLEGKMKIYREKYGKKKKKQGTLFEKQQDIYANESDQNDKGGNAFYQGML
jgi:ubiquitin conjugation factor E4 B